MFQASRSVQTALWPALVASLSILAASAVTTSAFAQAGLTPDGIWYTKGEESIIKVHACTGDADSLCGTLVWLKDPKEADGTLKVDKLNKDPAKQKRPMVGVDILLNMKPVDDHWKGKAYNPEDGKLYEITFKPKEDDTADLRGCVLGFLCQTEQFTRAKEVPGGDPTASVADAKKAHKGKASAKR